ncbi:MAG TPA: efflux RND transporter periplasmic adaptor subunit, partial [Vicinamibacteria bacterium]
AGFGLVGAGLVGASALQARSQAKAALADPTRSAALAATRDATRRVAAEGRVVAYPGAEVRVGAERAGRLVSVRVREGDVVKRGDLLGEIESEELGAGLAEARARVLEAEAEARLAESSRERRQKLFEQQILAVNDLDQANRDLEIALARRETAQASVARYEAQIRKSLLHAPISGTVIARNVDAGQTVEAGDHTFTLADLTRLRIEGEAHEADASAVNLGAPVTITADGFPGRTWKGQVEEIPDSVTLRRLKPQDPSRPTDTRILAVKVSFAEPTPLKLGTTVELAIEPLR